MTAQPTADGLLAIGRIGRAHGLKGELRVELFFADSDALEQVDELWLSPKAEAPDGGKLYAIEQARPVPKAYLVQLAGVSERNGAEALRGSIVWVPRAAIATDDGEYFLVDLIGATVTGPEGEVGTVIEIATHPSVDAVVIKTADGRTVEQPLLDEWVSRVSVAERMIELSSLDGLIS